MGLSDVKYINIVTYLIIHYFSDGSNRLEKSLKTSSLISADSKIKYYSFNICDYTLKWEPKRSSYLWSITTS